VRFTELEDPLDRPHSLVVSEFWFISFKNINPFGFLRTSVLESAKINSFFLGGYYLLVVLHNRFRVAEISSFEKDVRKRATSHEFPICVIPSRHNFYDIDKASFSLLY